MDKDFYLVPGYTKEDKRRYKLFWDDVFEDILLDNNYDILIDILQELHDFTLNLVPSRKDLHVEFSEIVDIDFIKQKLEHKVFSHEDFNNLFSYWIDWVKKLGSEENEEIMDELKEEIVELSNKHGYEYVLPYAYFELYNEIHNIDKEVTKLRKLLKEQKNSE